MDGQTRKCCCSNQDSAAQPLTAPTALIHESGHQISRYFGVGTRGVKHQPLIKPFRQPRVKLQRFGPVGHRKLLRMRSRLFIPDMRRLLHCTMSWRAGIIRFFSFCPCNPHPISYIRVLLGVEMCRQFFGTGPWDNLAYSWQHSHLFRLCRSYSTGNLTRFFITMPKISELVLSTPMQAFGGKALVDYY